MEWSATLLITIVLLAGGGAAGAVMLTEGGLMSDADAGGITQVDPLPYNGEGSCFRGADTGAACGTGGCSNPEEIQDTGCACCGS
ncbi:MAG: hypothetical protein JSW25_06595 [Thermoplasmata archaeon]|nr:MAG: hypothetical protein JSW25_06595 [Thermoplasmata archaeon]